MKKTIIPILTALLLFSGNVFALSSSEKENNEKNESTSWTVDKDHSSINFSVRHFFTPVTGRFNDFEADIQFNPDNPENGKLDITIPISYINTENTRRDNHLASEDFFNSEKWPNMRFVSSDIQKTGDNKYVAYGELTIRDVTKTVELPFELLGVMEHPMMDDTQVAGIEAGTKIKRTDFGVGVGDWAATMVVGDDVDININLELTATL